MREVQIDAALQRDRAGVVSAIVANRAEAGHVEVARREGRGLIRASIAARSRHGPAFAPERAGLVSAGPRPSHVPGPPAPPPRVRRPRTSSGHPVASSSAEPECVLRIRTRERKNGPAEPAFRAKLGLATPVRLPAGIPARRIRAGRRACPGSPRVSRSRGIRSPGVRCGGEVYHVTTLGDSGPGSFHDAVSRGPRIVVFDVGGYIELASPVSVHSDITIAGQSAPGGGVATKNYEVSFSGSTNIILDHISIEALGTRTSRSP